MLLNDIEHLPKVVTDINGINDILLAIEPEIIQLRTDISDLLKELYVKTTENLISRWEADFGLKYDASLTLEQRRQRVLNKLARKRTLTWENLRLLVKNNLAENVQFYLSNDSANYKFKIIVNPGTEKVYNSDAFTVVGSPTITSDGIASGFSASNYLTIPVNLNSYNNWKLTFPIPSNVTSTDNVTIFSVKGANCLQIGYRAPDGRFGYNLSSNGTSWDIGNSAAINSNLANVQNAVFVLEYTGTQYLLYGITSNGTRYNLVTINNSSKLYNSGEPFLIGVARSVAGGLSGQIDLKQFFIIANGVTVVSGEKEAPRSTAEMEQAVRLAKPAYLTFEVIITDLYRRCGTFNCGSEPL